MTSEAHHRRLASPRFWPSWAGALATAAWAAARPRPHRPTRAYDGGSAGPDRMVARIVAFALLLPAPSPSTLPCVIRICWGPLSGIPTVGPIG